MPTLFRQALTVTGMCAIALGSTLLSAAANDLLPEPTEPQQAPEFSAVDSAGASHQISDYRDQALVVNFWATWCPPCIKEMPSLQRASTALKDANVTVLAINMGDSVDDVAAFGKQAALDFPLLMDEEMELGPLWGLKGLPTTYIVAPGGKVAHVVVGEREWDDPQIVERIRQLANP